MSYDKMRACEPRKNVKACSRRISSSSSRQATRLWVHAKRSTAVKSPVPVKAAEGEETLFGRH